MASGNAVLVLIFGHRLFPYSLKSCFCDKTRGKSHSSKISQPVQSPLFIHLPSRINLHLLANTDAAAALSSPKEAYRKILTKNCLRL